MSEQLNQQNTVDTAEKLMEFVIGLYRGDGENVLSLGERRDRIYEEYPSKMDIDQAVEALNLKIAELRKRLEEHEKLDKDSARQELNEKMAECGKLSQAINAIGKDNELAKPMLTRWQELKEEVDKIAESLDCSGIQENMDFLESILRDFQSVTKYFERTARTISEVQQDLTDIPTRLGAPMPLSVDVAKGDIEARRNAVRRYVTRLRQHEIITRPGTGKSGEYLNEGELLKDRVVEFFGGEVEQDVERYEVAPEPDREEVSMALFFAGVEDTPANRSVYRSKLKTGEIQMFRQQVADLMKENKVSRGHQLSYRFLEYMCKNLVAKMASATDKDREIVQSAIAKALTNDTSDYGELLGVDALAKDMKDVGHGFAGSFERHGFAVSSNQLSSLAIARLFDLSQKKKKTLSESETARMNDEVKVIISESLPFANYYIAVHGLGKVQKLLEGLEEAAPGFVGFTEAEGLFVKEDLEGTSDKDAYNLILFEAFQKGLAVHNAKKDAEALKIRKKSLRSCLDINIRQVRHGAQQAVESHDKFAKKKEEHDTEKTKLEESRRLIAEAQSVQIFLGVIDDLRGLGVKGITNQELKGLGLDSGILLEVEFMEAFTVNANVIDYIIQKANKKAGGLLCSASTQSEINALIEKLMQLNKQNYPLFFHGRNEVVSITKILRASSKAEETVDVLSPEMEKCEKEFIERMDRLISSLKEREEMLVDAEELLDDYEDKLFGLPFYDNSHVPRKKVLGEEISKLRVAYEIRCGDVENIREFERLLELFSKEK